MNNNYNFELFEAKKEDFENIRTQNAENAVRKHKNNNNKKKRIITSVIVILGVFVIICAAVLISPFLSSNHNPDKFAAKYVKNIIRNNWEEVYDGSQFYNSQIITKEYFVNYCGQNKQVTMLNDTQISDYIIEKDEETDSSINYSIHYVTEDENEGVYYLTVRKTEDKFWKYDTYKAVLQGNSVCNIKVFAPLGTEVSINSVKLTNAENITERSISNSRNIYLNEYDIPLLEDTYNIEAQNDNCNSYSQSAEINRQTENYFVEMTLSESAYNALCNKGIETIKSMYTQACSGSLTQQSIRTSETFSGDNFDSVINDIQNSVYSSDSTVNITDFEITDTTLKSSYSDKTKLGYEDDGQTEIIFTFNYKYTINNTATATSEQREDQGYADVEFIYQNSQWVVNNIACRAYF